MKGDDRLVWCVYRLFIFVLDVVYRQWYRMMRLMVDGTVRSARFRIGELGEEVLPGLAMIEGLPCIVLERRK